MVVVKEATGMFWGVTLDTGKRYTQTVERSFHISMAALEPKQAGGANANVCVMLQHEKSDYLMCTLSQNRPYQQELDLNFTQGEEVTFYLNGTGIVHLTGYLMDEGVLDDTMDRDRFGSDTFEMTEEFSDEDSDDESDEDDEDDDDEDDSEQDSEPAMSTAFGDLETTQSTDEEDADWTEARKRKLKHALKAAKKIRTDGAQDDEDDDDDSMDMTSSTMDTSQFSDEEDESDEESETPVATPSKKGGQNKKQAKQQAAKLAASGGKVNQAAVKQNSQTQSSKKAKGQTPKGQTPKAEVKQEQKSPKVAGKPAKKGGEKVKAKSEPPTPSAPKGGKNKTPKVENGPAKTTQADGSPDQSPGLSKSAKKRQKQKEKKRLSLAEAKKE